ncbi:SDR family NAD(P)-dependent oxidoreductase [Nocardia farcinica]|uniref:SDR family NAD(P)-dependent oxidoreductase n=1 Tax=Nocardia farcinica TaxID=37329 RepID=UPI00189627AA|nr:SDR family NAD(P)-dependent oxidoreductase [Nocardia farcinica]MBF6260324.1 SDR family NAD(P)-dependent oxidoreductase [Nocardia farcinica]MBF6280006.1 SDR family NAD(P)-dependent oxidoreductase [Nocardia farcinica]MBF6303334.1 SDR family NAD(P)-dependent oxidoreductase [Nocardia farcinica]MBF6388376.1 SDR family NAD(P)-dependent oxidoreductase [Nocardia farcinica]MBF6492174.1 SDR family NAD(P)-dependent oxidoreductase [Nocardia farcinica]
MTTTHPLALVTGASRGIGYELAREFADRGYDVVMAAEDTAIEAAADRIRRPGHEVRAVQVDLRTSEGVERLYSAATEDERPLDAVALNAGVGRGGAFTETDLADELSIVDLNVRSTVHLAKLVLGDMVRRDAGGLLFTSSVASMMPGARQAVYNASKAFVQSFAEALREEVRDTGVTVTALMPGPTDTDFFRRAGLLDTPVGRGPKEDPAKVARQGIEALLADKQKVIGGSLPTRAIATVTQVLPDSVKATANRLMSAALPHRS